MNTPKHFEAELATKNDLARLKAELETAVRERDEHRTATLFMLEDLEENRKRIERARQEWVRVFDGVRDPIFVHDREFRIVRSNLAYAERAGMAIQEVIGKPYWEVFPKREGPLPGCYSLEKVAEAEAEAEEEVRIDSGEIFLSRSFIVHDAAGAFLFAVHIMEDITKRKRAEEAVIKAGEEFHVLFDSIADCIFIADTEGHFLQVNHSACERLGYSQEELLRMSAADIDTPECAAKLPERIKAIQEGGQLVFESAHVRKDGGVIPIELNVRLINYGGKPALLSVARDITQRKEHEARIEHLNRLIRSARNINRLLTSEKDRGSLLQFTCDVLVREAGYRMVWIGTVQQGQPEVMPMAKSGIGAAGYLESITVTCDDTPTGHGPAGTAIRTHQPSIIQDIARDPRFILWKDIALQNGYRACANFPLISDNTTYGVLNLYAGKPDAFDAEEIALLDEVADDIAFALRGMDVESDRKRAEQALRDSEETLRTISSSAQDAIVMADNDGRIAFWNPSAARLFGYTAEEATGKPLYDLIVPERLREKHQSGFEKFSATGQGPVIGKVLELPSLRKDGTEFVAEHSISAVQLEGKWHAVAVVRDITERKLGEERLRESAAELNEAQRVARLGNWDLDTETGNVTWSEELYRIFGRDPVLPAPGYKEHARILAPESYARMNAAIEKTRQDGEPYELDLELVRPDGTRKWITARGEAKRDVNGQIVGLRGTALDISERKRAEADRQQYAERLGRSLEETIRAVALTVEMRDPYTAGHQRRVADLAGAIGTELGLPEEQIHGLHLAGTIHDLGKIHIPAEILSKPGKLTDIEFSFIKTHPQAGYDILKDVEFPWPIAQIVLQHHERLDGGGYPQGLKAEQILIEARILAVADVVEAMASHRPYRPALGVDAALSEIIKCRGTQFGSAVVDACVRLFKEKGFTFAQ